MITNGSAPTTDDDIVVAVQQRIDNRRARVTELESELAEHRSQLKRDEKVVALLTGEDQQKPRPTSKPGARPVPSKVGPQQLAGIEAAIRRYAEDHEEFRQVDIRKMPDTPTDKSSMMALAFEQLRQDNVIRFVRQVGISKVYRLTRESVQA